MFAMFTPDGNTAVVLALYRLLADIRTKGASKPLHDVLEAIEQEVRDAGHPEVSDTAVRDAIYLHLLDNQHITQVEMVG